MEEILKRVLDKLRGPDLWIALAFISIGIVCWKLGATEPAEMQPLQRRLVVAAVIGMLGTSIIAVRHFVNRERPFAEGLTGILVMRINGDDDGLLQTELIANLNAELQKESTGQEIEVHAGSELIDEKRGRAAAHKRARIIGTRRNATLVIWGQKIGDKKFYPRITVITLPKGWTASSDRTNDAQIISELRLPQDVIDEPFYLIWFATGYSHLVQEKYRDALPYLKAALGRKGASTDELADLQFFTALCMYNSIVSHQDINTFLEDVINLYEKAADAYQCRNGEVPARLHKWIKAEINLGLAYSDLAKGDPTENLTKAIAAYQAALRICTEKNFPNEWAIAQNNLGVAYWSLPSEDKSELLAKAIEAYQAALRVHTEKDFPVDWAKVQNNLGTAYRDLPTGDRDGQARKAAAAYEAALRVIHRAGYPLEWARIQMNLGLLYGFRNDKESIANLRRAEAHLEAALVVYSQSPSSKEHNDLTWFVAEVRLRLRTAEMIKTVKARMSARESTK